MASPPTATRDRKEPDMYVGWDWASESHDVTVVDEAGTVAARFAIDHDEASLDGVLGELAALGAPGELPVAIERPDGIIVERLLAAGHPVVAVHPNAFHAARSRWGAGRAKSDPADSYMLADYLRTDGHRLRRLRPLDTTTRELQALVRMRDDHVAARTAATNQLHALLEAHWPGANAIFSRLGSAIALAFLADYPTPQAAARLGEARLAMFCRRHSYRGGRTPAELLHRLRVAPIAPVGLDPTVLSELVRAQTTLIESALRTIAELDAAIGASLLSHPKTRLLAPLPRIGEVNLAQVIAEIGPLLDRCDTADQAAAACGVAPVTRQSGKSRNVQFRFSSNARARVALTCFADNARHSSPWAQHLYTAARQRGIRHPHAVRILGRSWLRVIWACWHTNTVYDPTRHASETPTAA
jgi:transposase